MWSKWSIISMASPAPSSGGAEAPTPADEVQGTSTAAMGADSPDAPAHAVAAAGDGDVADAQAAQAAGAELSQDTAEDASAGRTT